MTEPVSPDDNLVSAFDSIDDEEDCFPLDFSEWTVLDDGSEDTEINPVQWNENFSSQSLLSGTDEKSSNGCKNKNSSDEKRNPLNSSKQFSQCSKKNLQSKKKKKKKLGRPLELSKTPLSEKPSKALKKSVNQPSDKKLSPFLKPPSESRSSSPGQHSGERKAFSDSAVDGEDPLLSPKAPPALGSNQNVKKTKSFPMKPPSSSKTGLPEENITSNSDVSENKQNSNISVSEIKQNKVCVKAKPANKGSKNIKMLDRGSIAEIMEASKAHELKLQQKTSGVAGKKQLQQKTSGVAETKQLQQKTSGVAETKQLQQKTSGVAGMKQLQQKMSGVAETKQLQQKTSGVAETKQLQQKTSGVAETKQSQQKTSGVAEMKQSQQKTSGVAETKQSQQKTSGVAETKQLQQKTGGVAETKQATVKRKIGGEQPETVHGKKNKKSEEIPTTKIVEGVTKMAFPSPVPSKVGDRIQGSDIHLNSLEKNKFQGQQVKSDSLRQASSGGKRIVRRFHRASQTDAKCVVNKFVQCRPQPVKKGVSIGTQYEGEECVNSDFVNSSFSLVPKPETVPKEMFEACLEFKMTRRISSDSDYFKYGLRLGYLLPSDVDKPSFRDTFIKKADSYNLSFGSREYGILDLFVYEEENLAHLINQIRKTKLGSRHLCMSVLKKHDDSMLSDKLLKATVIFDQNFASSGYLSYYKMPIWSKPKVEEHMTIHNIPGGIPLSFLNFLFPDAISIQMDDPDLKLTKAGSRVKLGMNRKHCPNHFKGLFTQVLISDVPVFLTSGLTEEKDVPEMKEIIVLREQQSESLKNKIKEKKSENALKAVARDINLKAEESQKKKKGKRSQKKAIQSSKSKTISEATQKNLDVIDLTEEPSSPFRDMNADLSEVSDCSLNSSEYGFSSGDEYYKKIRSKQSFNKLHEKYVLKSRKKTGYRNSGASSPLSMNSSKKIKPVAHSSRNDETWSQLSDGWSPPRKERSSRSHSQWPRHTERNKFYDDDFDDRNSQNSYGRERKQLCAAEQSARSGISYRNDGNRDSFNNPPHSEINPMRRSMYEADDLYHGQPKMMKKMHQSHGHKGHEDLRETLDGMRNREKGENPTIRSFLHECIDKAKRKRCNSRSPERRILIKDTYASTDSHGLLPNPPKKSYFDQEIRDSSAGKSTTRPEKSMDGDNFTVSKSVLMTLLKNVLGNEESSDKTLSSISGHHTEKDSKTADPGSNIKMLFNLMTKENTKGDKYDKQGKHQVIEREKDLTQSHHQIAPEPAYLNASTTSDKSVSDNSLPPPIPPPVLPPILAPTSQAPVSDLEKMARNLASNILEISGSESGGLWMAPTSETVTVPSQPVVPMETIPMCSGLPIPTPNSAPPPFGSTPMIPIPPFIGPPPFPPPPIPHISVVSPAPPIPSPVTCSGRMPMTGVWQAPPQGSYQF